VTGGKVGHDVARVLVEVDYLEPGNQIIAVGAGPKVHTTTVGQIDTANCGGMKVVLALQGDMEVIYIPSCNDAKYVLLLPLLPISVHCVWTLLIVCCCRSKLDSLTFFIQRFTLNVAKPLITFEVETVELVLQLLDIKYFRLAMPSGRRVVCGSGFLIALPVYTV
jgi:hypothetical protein